MSAETDNQESRALAVCRGPRVQRKKSPIHGAVNRCFDAMLEVNCLISAAEIALRDSRHVIATQRLERALKKLTVLIPQLNIAAYEAKNLSLRRRIALLAANPKARAK